MKTFMIFFTKLWTATRKSAVSTRNKTRKENSERKLAIKRENQTIKSLSERVNVQLLAIFNALKYEKDLGSTNI